MKATSRRRVLISSVAMLLVAMLALGTATFAWFTTQSQANASGIAATTTKSSELKLAKLDLVYNESITYGLNKALKPASSVDGTNWYMGVAAAKGNYAVNAAGFDKIDTTTAGQNNVSADKTNVVYVYDEMLNIKNFGGSTCNGVTITVNATFTSQCGRIAIVPCAAQTTANTYSAITAANFKNNIYSAAAGTTWKGVKGEGAASTSTTEDMTATKKAAGASISVGNINANATKSYRILVWFEGNDDTLFDTTDNSNLTIGSISFTVAGTTAA